MKTRRDGSGWLHIIPGILCLGFLLPILSLLHQSLSLGKTALFIDALPMVAAMARTTVAVGAIAVALALLLGWLAAWAVSGWLFFGRSLISVLLCLPFAFPSYLVAGIYRSMHWEYPTLFPSPEGVVGAGLVFGLTLYPWVYVPMKMQLASQSAQYGELGRALGMNRWQRFFRIRLGLLAPTLGIVSLLVFMEVLSDFGTVSMLGVKTLSVGIHDAMFSMYRRDWAAQLSLIGLSMPITAVLLFSFLYRKRKTYQPPNRWMPVNVKQASGVQQCLLLGLLGFLLAVTCLLPMGLLLRWAARYIGRLSLAELPAQITDSLIVTFGVAVGTLAFGLLLSVLPRFCKSLSRWRSLAVLVNLNYAIPSVMLAIAVLFVSTGLPQSVVSLVLSESVVLLVIAGCLTYTCFPYFSIAAGLETLSPRIDDLCRVLGLNARIKVVRIFLPLVKRSIAAGMLLVIVNMLKDLTLSQVLHPFGYQSLSMRLYSYAGMGMLEESSLFGLVLVSLSIYPVVALDRLLRREGCESSC